MRLKTLQKFTRKKAFHVLFSFAFFLVSVPTTVMGSAEDITNHEDASPQSPHSTRLEPQIFEYASLTENAENIVRYLHEFGFIAVRGVPGFIESRAEFLTSAQEFTALSDDLKDQCTTSKEHCAGWAMGVETFNGKTDTYKGSYYAAIGDDNPRVGDNVWPLQNQWDQAEQFKNAYLTLATLMFETGKEILPLIGLNNENLKALGRMLHYARPPKTDTHQNDTDGNPNWCGVHRDHGYFTALIPSLFVRDGQPVKKPAGSGLHIYDWEVVVPDDVMMFQVGEAAELISDGKIKATPHHVKKAYGGLERFTLALFMDTPFEVEMRVSDPDNIDPEYKSRFTQGMTYGKWSEESYKRYKVEDEPSQ